MGAFLATPVTEKISENAENEDIICGGSSMQGWRSTQEDAHNCILNFDTKTSLFAVYDGHGGADVAIYSSQHLPDAIKKTESYAKGDYVQALKDAFLEFDATLVTDGVVKELQKIAQKHNDEAEEDTGTEDIEESVNELYQEATMPLADVMARYKNPSLQGKLPASPFLRAKKNESDPGASSSSSSSFDAPGCSSTSFSNSDSEVSSSSGGASSSKKESTNEVAATSSSGAEIAPSCTSSAPSSSSPSKSASSSNPDSSSSNKIDSACSSSKKDATEKVLVNGIGDPVSSSQNGEDGKKEAENAVSGGSGDSVKSSKSNSDNVISSSDSSETKESAKKRISPTRLGSSKLYSNLLAQGNGVDSSESDEDDETFTGATPESDDDDDEDDDDDDDDEDGGEEEGIDDGLDDEEDSDDLEDEEGEEDSDLEDEDDDGFCFSSKEKVGEDSGCTAVVALVHNNTLYVANAGDSRCVVSRDREAVEMSFDHKPEDPLEKRRIVNAGGKVTQDGRVNGGLNLSRALGDHTYKKNPSVAPTEQMISALPDIKTLEIDRSKDEFMVLACDGIWNSLTSQEVVDFIGERLDKGANKLTNICEELFDHCLAPDTMGDGTGCDNMTCIIVQWKKPGETNGLDSKSTSETKVTQDNQPAEPTEASTISSESKTESEKRCASPDMEESSRKKSKIEGDPSD